MKKIYKNIVLIPDMVFFLKENNIEFDYTTGANFHNRFKEAEGVQRPYNMKVQVPQGNSAKGKDLNNARMVEFIVNLDTGEFDSQWDAYDKHKLAMVVMIPIQENILMKN